MYLKQFEVSPLSVFCYVVGCEKTREAIVIDPAADCDMIIEEAEHDGFKILKIVNTHGHIDHIMGNAEMKKKTNAPIVIHEADAKAIADVPFFKLLMFNAEASPPADQTVKDGDVITYGEKELKVIHTPGHSPGSICLLTERHLFTGDTLFVESVGRTDLPGGSWKVLYQSVQERIFSLPDDTIVLPGHNYGRRPTTTVGEEKLSNPFFRQDS